MAKKRKKISKKEPSWDQIGEQIGSKMDKEMKKNDWKCWSWHHESRRGGHFFAALLFAILVLWSLDLMGYATDLIPSWMKILIIITFAIMFS